VSAATVRLEERHPAGASESILAALLPSLHRLDQLLEGAVRAMQPATGSNVTASFPGLYISRDQVDQLLSQEPGQSRFQLVRDLCGEKPRTAADRSPLGWLALVSNTATNTQKPAFRLIWPA
jgi:hypothetical protein